MNTARHYSKSLTYHIIICSTCVFIFLILSNIFYSFFRLGDDTFIYLQYTRSLIEYNEFAFNNGEPTYGFTSPLWIFLLVITVKITKSYLQAPHLLTLFFSVLTIIVWFFILKKSEMNIVVKFLFLLIITIDPNLLKHSYLGMEATASFFLSSLAILILINDENISFKISLAILFGFYILLRPESIIIYTAIIFSLLITKKINAIDLIKMLIITFLLTMPWIIFSFFYFGSVLPTTLSAKGASYGLGIKFFTQLIDSLKIFLGNYLPMILVIIIGLFNIRSNNIFFVKYSKAFIISALSIFGLIFFYAFILNKEIVYARYFCMVFPFLYWLLMILTSVYKLKLKRTYTYLALILLFSIGVTIVFSNLTNTIYQDEKVEDKIVFWIEENTEPSDLIVRGRIGKIGFFSHRKIVDPMGIINPDIIKYNKGDSSYLYYAKTKPRYFVGSFDIQRLKNFGRVTLLKEYKPIIASLTRHLFLGEIRYTSTSIYRIDWY